MAQAPARFPWYSWNYTTKSVSRPSTKQQAYWFGSCGQWQLPTAAEILNWNAKKEEPLDNF